MECTVDIVFYFFYYLFDQFKVTFLYFVPAYDTPFYWLFTSVPLSLFA